jgi:hypothetical protein
MPDGLHINIYNNYIKQKENEVENLYDKVVKYCTSRSEEVRTNKRFYQGTL